MSTVTESSQVATTATPSDKSEADKLIDRKELLELVPLCAKTIYNMEKRGDFPPRIAITSRRVAWKLQDVRNWLESRRSAKSVAPPAA